MSQFAGYGFRVMPVGENNFPLPALDSEGKYIYNCRAFILHHSWRVGLANWVTLVTWKRPLGTISVIGHIEAGRGKSTLVIPDGAGFFRYHTAVLVGMTNVEAYGRRADAGYFADLSFVITSNPVG